MTAARPGTMCPQIRPFRPDDHAQARQFWERTEGIGPGAADEEQPILAFLRRNPGLSFVAADADRVVGTILVGHDGRRGLIHHLAVAETHRRQGLGSALLQAGLAALAAEGIRKCHLFVFADNRSGLAFWQAAGATLRDDLVIWSLAVPPPVPPAVPDAG